MCVSQCVAHAHHTTLTHAVQCDVVILVNLVFGAAVMPTALVTRLTRLTETTRERTCDKIYIKSFLKPTLVYFSGKWSDPRDSRIGAATEKATVFLVAVRDTSCSSVCGCSVWLFSLVCMGKKTRFGDCSLV